MKNSTLILMVLCLSLVLAGCSKSPTEPQIPTATPIPVVTVTPVPTLVPTATATPITCYYYVKIVGYVAGVASSFPLHVWIESAGPVNKDLFNGTAVIDLSDNYVWQSKTSDGYVGEIFVCYCLIPSNDGLNVEIHKIANGVDTWTEIYNSFLGNQYIIRKSSVYF